MITISMHKPRLDRSMSLARRNDQALRSLMNQWEREPLTETESDDSDVGLMILLSGMVGSHATAFDTD